jgi:hypothetical protein
MKIQYYTAPCGAGKSYQAAKKMIYCTGRYLVVRDRVEAIQEYAGQLTTMASEAGVALPITTITSQKGSSVRYEVEMLPQRYGCLSHVIVVITHKAMMMSDFSGFEGWRVIIDETPVVLDRQELQTSQSREFFERNYELAEVNKAWSSVTLSCDGWTITPADLEADDCFRLLRVFHERVTSATPLPIDATTRMSRRAHDHEPSRRAVIGNIQEWGDMEDGRRWSWWSLWSPHQLDAFESIEMMANGFDQSMTFAMLKTFNPDIEWVEVKLGSSRQFKPRTVRIEYFAEKHVASQTLFDAEEGRANLRAIGRYLSKRDQIWMANDRHAEHLDGIGGIKLRPHQAGSNQWSGIHNATCIYSAKPSEETRAVMDFMNVPPSAWTHSHEFEAILQFAARTSIRDPQSGETVTLAVYDKDQADYLATYFRAQPHCLVEVTHVELGLVDEVRQRGRKKAILTPGEADAKKAERAAKKLKAQQLRRAKGGK